MGRERRRRSRRSSTSRSSGQAISGQATAVPGTPAAEASSTRAAAPSTGTPAAHPAHVRSDRVLARESQTMLDEMKRVFLVSGVCFGMLIVLVVVERLQ